MDHDRFFSHAEDITVESTPPVVVKTIPQSGANNVDPSTKEIIVSFSKEMADGSWSWASAGKNNFPASAGKPYYQADKMSVRLSP